ncbi:MAG: sugar phosphate isomerase/epimerase [Lentisphaerae bacterium]|nr:sugar phosphate isomerase/epimerase [Lentisphaerota bacterium]
MSHMEVGVLSSAREDGGNPFETIARYGVRCTQFANWDPARWTREGANRLAADARRCGVKLAAIWAGYSGEAVWNFSEGPQTLGLVPPRQRARRVKELQQAADFAARCGAPAIVTHCGFIPENPSDRLYAGTLEAIGAVARHCRKRGVGFWFETGQETPVTLLRVIEDLGLPNLGINLDTANLILYGKGNPVDALDVFGRYVRNLHAKDGRYPTNGRTLGAETPIGTGKVDFYRLFRKLDALGFDGEVVIEREIRGPQQARDIKQSIGYLRRLIGRAAATRRKPRR